ESTTASNTSNCILHKQHFKSRLAELNMWINRIEGACDDVKMSLKLKKVLKTILKVGNQMNDGEQHLGFTVDSLLKLQNAKAFDKKTSILQYVVMVIQRNDESCLLFPEDLTHLTESERMSLSQISQELDTLRASQVKSMEVVREMRVQAGDQSVASMVKFLEKAQQSIDEVSESVNRMQEKYQTVLAYFGEDPDTLSQEFFSTLEKFVR
ncbi:Daam2, partial [Symbiodinium microadriaticum]